MLFGLQSQSRRNYRARSKAINRWDICTKLQNANCPKRELEL